MIETIGVRAVRTTVQRDGKNMSVTVGEGEDGEVYSFPYEVAEAVARAIGIRREGGHLKDVFGLFVPVPDEDRALLLGQLIKEAGLLPPTTTFLTGVAPQDVRLTLVTPVPGNRLEA